MRRSGFLLVFLAVLAICSGGCFTRAGSDECLTIHFLNIKEGNAALVVTPHKKTVLIDAGDLLGGYDAALYLKKQGISLLDYLILTHQHLDHFGGVFFIARMFKVSRIFDNGQDGGDLGEKPVNPWGFHYNYDRLVRFSKDYQAVKKGDMFELDGVKFKVLWPPSPAYQGSTNDNSIVILAEYGKFKCLFTSDITAKAEHELVAEYGDLLKADVLQLSHHGSIDASSEEFLQAVKPEAAVVAAAKNFPSSRVLKRLKDYTDKVYLNSEGDVVISAGKEGKFVVKQ